MFKLVLEKAEEREVKLPTSTRSSKKQESSRKTSISALLTMPKPLTVWITINCGNSERDSTGLGEMLAWSSSSKRLDYNLFSFTFIKRLFSSSSLSAIRVVLSAYLRSLIFLLAILIPACVSSSPVFLMMYSAHKLNKQGDNIQP